MMKEIMLINPRKRKVKTKKRPTKKKAVRKTKKRAIKTVARKQGVSTMAKKRKTTKKRKYRPNPAKKRSYAKRAATRSISGLNFKSALKNVIMMDVGMFAAKFAAKRFGGGATETDPNSWNWRSYMQAGVGAAAAAMGVNMIRPGKGQRVLEGGLAYIGFKILENELIAGHPTAESWLGGADEPVDGELLLDLDGEPYAQWEGEELPLNDDYRMGDTIVPVGRLGDTIVPVGRLGGMGESRSDLMSAYDRAYGD